MYTDKDVVIPNVRPGHAHDNIPNCLFVTHMNISHHLHFADANTARGLVACIHSLSKPQCASLSPPLVCTANPVFVALPLLAQLFLIALQTWVESDPKYVDKAQEVFPLRSFTTKLHTVCACCQNAQPGAHACEA